MNEVMKDLKGKRYFTLMLFFTCNVYSISHAGMGESNAAHNRPHFIRRDTLKKAKDKYKGKYCTA